MIKMGSTHIGKNEGRIVGWHSDNFDEQDDCVVTVHSGRYHWSNKNIKRDYKEADGIVRLIEKVGIDNKTDVRLFRDWWPEQKRALVGAYLALVRVFGKKTLTFAEYVCIMFCQHLEPDYAGQFLESSEPDKLDGFVLGVNHSCKFFMMSGSEFDLGGASGRVVYTGGSYPTMSLVLSWLDMNKEIDRYVSRT